MGIYIPGWNGQKPGECHARDEWDNDCPFLKRQGTAGYFYCSITGGFVDEGDNGTEKPCPLQEVSDVDMSRISRDISLSDILYFADFSQISVEVVQRIDWDSGMSSEEVPREIIYIGTGLQLRNRLPSRLLFSKVFAMLDPKDGRPRFVVEDVKDSVLER